MAKEYKVGERYYLPVAVFTTDAQSIDPIGLKYVYTGNGNTGAMYLSDYPNLLLTAEEVAQDVNTERDDALAELKSRNAELEALLKEVMATRDEAIKQNNELIAENKKLKDGADKLKDTLVDRTKDVQYYKAESERLNAYYMEANRTASEAAEANDELKAKIADLRNRVGEQLAQIQDLNAEVHFHKEFGEGLDKQQKELQARYEELDSVNKEQAEKIRRQDKALTDLKKRNDDLQAENTNLTFLLEDAPEKETTKALHVVLNDGTEIEFRRYTAYDYRTDIKMFVVKDGERFIAGFNRGDKSFNFAYWWTE